MSSAAILVALVVLLALLLVGAQGRRPAGVHRALRLHGADVSHRFADLCEKGRPVHHSRPASPSPSCWMKTPSPRTASWASFRTRRTPPSSASARRATRTTPRTARLVHYKNVIGTPVFSIPYLGYVADYIQHPARDVHGHLCRRCPAPARVPADIFAEEDDKEKDKSRREAREESPSAARPRMIRQSRLPNPQQSKPPSPQPRRNPRMPA